MIPLHPGQAKAAPTWRAAWSDRTAALMAGLCVIAYGTETADEIAPAGFRLARTFERGGERVAYLAVSADLAALVFRGTSSPADWRIDLDAGRALLPGTDVLVHRGFLRAWVALAADVKAAVADEVPRDLGLYVTGHSLGGGVAQLASAALERDTLAACYTFGSPRVGTRDFDRQVKAPHYRVVNGWDLVPGVPAPWMSGYRHSGDARLLTGDGLEAYRRDRSLLGRFAVDLAGLAGVAATRRLPCVADHAIELYRARLDAIALAREPRLPSAKSD